MKITENLLHNQNYITTKIECKNILYGFSFLYIFKIYKRQILQNGALVSGDISKRYYKNGIFNVLGFLTVGFFFGFFHYLGTLTNIEYPGISSFVGVCLLTAIIIIQICKIFYIFTQKRLVLLKIKPKDHAINTYFVNTSEGLLTNDLYVVLERDKSPKNKYII